VRNEIKRTKSELSTCYLLRQAFSRSCLYWAAMHKVKKDANQYECEGCHKIFKLREVNVDHKVPVIDPEKGWENIQIFASRLFCAQDNLQVLCTDNCHHNKSVKENKTRRSK